MPRKRCKLIPDPITIADAAAVNHNFVRQGQGPNTSTWVDSASTPEDKLEIKIRHQRSGTGSNATVRHTVSFIRSKLNSTTGKMEVMTFTSTLIKPELSTTLTATMRTDLQTYLKTFWSSTAANGWPDRIYRLET